MFSVRSLRPGGLVAACLLAGCTVAPDLVPPAIRVGYSGEVDFADLPSFIAHDRLRAEGLAIEVTHFSAPDLAIEAAARGSVDVIHATMVGAWQAAVRGARIRTIADHVANPYRLVAVREIVTCAALDGRRLALASESSVSTALVRAFVAEDCPGARPVPVIAVESTHRAAALFAGGVDAAAVDLNTWLWVMEQAPGRFHMLSDFSRRWPGIKTTGVHVNVDFAERSPRLVDDYLRALREAGREAEAGPARVVSHAMKRLGAGRDWGRIAAAYHEEKVWAGDGVLTDADVSATLSFFSTHSGLPGHVLPDAVVDPRFLRRAGDGPSHDGSMVR